MKILLAVLVGFAGVSSSLAAPMKKAEGRTIGEIDIIPTNVLQRSISPKFYRSLLISPIKGWTVVRGQLSGTKLGGLRVVHSEPNKLNDHLALQRAGEVQLAGHYGLENANTRPSVLVHVLLYETQDGTLALSFAHLDRPGGDQQKYWGSARLSVLKHNGTWVDIKGPPGLEGKGWAVRDPGMRNSHNNAILRLESTPKIEGGYQ